MKALVTGGAGFIGSHIVDALLAEGHDVRVLDNLSTGSESNLSDPRSIELIRGDLRDLDTVRRAAKDIDTVFHLAAIPSVPRSIHDPLLCHEVNSTGTLHVLLAARDAGARRVVFASSSSVYGENGELPRRESMPPCPASPYAASKLAGEHACRQFYQHFGLETVALRYFNVFGPRQSARSAYAAVIPCFVESVLNGISPTIYGDGEQTRDFVYVRNVVAANLAAAYSPAAPGNVYNIACGERISLNELLRSACRLAERDVMPRYQAPRVGDVRDSLADISAARNDLGYEPLVRMADGLRELVACYQMPYLERQAA